MKSTRSIARLLEAAQRDRTRSNFRERFRLANGESILCESRGELDWWEQFCSAIQGGDLKPDEFSIQDVFESFVPEGREIVNIGRRHDPVSILEAAGPVSVGQFSNITGQIVFSKILEAYQDEQFLITPLFPTQTTQFNGEKIPGIARLGDQNEIVAEGQQYPYGNVSEDWVETPATVKRGVIVAVTKEAIFFDRTGLILKQAGEVGFWMGYNREIRAIDCLIDENTTTHRFKWRGTSYATYQTSTPWINSKTSNALVDWTDIDAVEQLFANMVDLNTGVAATILPTTLIVNPQLAHTAGYIQRATDFALQAGGFATSGNLVRTNSPNPLGKTPYSGSYSIISSRLMPGRTATDTDWFLGNPNRYAVYMQNFPLRTETAPPNSEAEFNRDIVTQYKASERGAFAVLAPQQMAKSAA